jgi:hypothetical protein
MTAPLELSTSATSARAQGSPRRSRSGARASLGGLALVAIGAVTTAGGLFADPARAWLNFLVDGFAFLSLGVGALFFISTQRLAGARWSAPLRRIAEAFMLTLPVAAGLMLVLGAGFSAIYPWAGGGNFGAAHEAVAAGRTTYLEPWFVVLRMAVVLALWCCFALRFRAISRRGDQDRAAGLDAHRRLDRLCAWFLPLFAFTFTAAAYDWIVSLEPKWFSTMFAVYVFAGAFAQSIAAITLVAALLHRRSAFTAAGAPLARAQLHDLGKMLFAFSTFWAYIWVCQYLLIWYGDLPEEVSYYVRRTSPPWLPWFLLNFALCWAIPFFTLLPVAAKRSARTLLFVSGVVLLGHWLDLYLMVMPSQWRAPRLGWIEVGMAAGFAGLFALLAGRALRRAPLLPPHDPLLPTPRGAPSTAAAGGPL